MTPKAYQYHVGSFCSEVCSLAFNQWFITKDLFI